MKRFIVFGLLASLLGGLSVASLSAEPPKANEKSSKHLDRAGDWIGQISKVDQKGASFTLTVKTAIPYARISEYNPRWITIASGIYYVTEHFTIWLPADTIIRVLAKPALDEKGLPIRGPVRPDPKDPGRRLGGVPGTSKDLKAGQMVYVWLERDHSSGSLFARAVVVDKEPPGR